MSVEPVPPAPRVEALPQERPSRARSSFRRGRVNEVGAGLRAIEGVATSVAAFVGLAAEGPFYRPILVTSWSQFLQTFGDYVGGTYLARTVHAYLANGGRACFVVRIGSDQSAAAPSSRAALTTGSETTSAAPVPKESLDRTELAALEALEALDEVTMVGAPDIMTALQNDWTDLAGLRAMQLALIEHCELMGDRMAILDCPPGFTAEEICTWRVGIAAYESEFATLYWPWVKTLDPAAGRHTFMPPCGHVAGVWSRNDACRGVHIVPADEVVAGVIDIERRISSGQQDLLDRVGVNALRALPGKGIRVFGARTLSADPFWQNINVRRVVNYLERSILNGTDWVVAESNDQRLWHKIENAVASFLASESRKGVLPGGAAARSFFVRCDSDTNPPEAVDAGQVTCEIGIAPGRPSEYLVFQLTRFADGLSMVTESFDGA